MKNLVSKQPLQTRKPGDAVALRTDSEGRLLTGTQENFSSPSGANPVYLEPPSGEAGMVDILIAVPAADIVSSKFILVAFEDGTIFKITTSERIGALAPSNNIPKAIQPLFLYLLENGIGAEGGMIFGQELGSNPFSFDFGPTGKRFSSLAVRITGADASTPLEYIPETLFIKITVKS
jgi:hypothetical protein